MNYVAFDDTMLQQAGALLAARQCQERLRLASLPTQYENPLTAVQAIEASWRKANTIGIGALEGNRLIGYMLGQLRDDVQRGRHMWIDYADAAVGQQVDHELYRDLYAVLAKTAVLRGHLDHYALIPAGDAAVLGAWHKSGFGYEQVHAAMPLHSVMPHQAMPSGVAVRRATSADRETMASMADIIWGWQIQSPVFAVTMPEKIADLREGYGELVDEEDAVIWIAELDGEPVAFQAYFPVDAEQASLYTPERAIELSVAGTLGEHRGRGINYAMTRYALAHAKEAGYAHCLTDWRMTNLQSSRFWPRQGFEPIAYRLVRRIDPRSAWITHTH